MKILPIQKILIDTKAAIVTEQKVIKTEKHEIHVGKCICNPDLLN